MEPRRSFDFTLFNDLPFGGPTRRAIKRVIYTGEEAEEGERLGSRMFQREKSSALGRSKGDREVAEEEEQGPDRALFVYRLPKIAQRKEARKHS